MEVQLFLVMLIDLNNFIKISDKIKKSSKNHICS